MMRFLLPAVVLFALPPVIAKGAAVATVVELQGEAFQTPKGGREKALTQGASLDAGTKVRTASSGSAKLRFKDGTEIRLRPKTAMRLSGVKRTKKKNSIVLFFGRLWNKVAPAGRRHYEVRTANAVCGVRGTAFETAVADDGSLRVDVEEGEVAVAADASSPETPVRAGKGVDADESGVGESYTAEEQAKWDLWEKRKRERLQKQGRSLIGNLKERIRARQNKISALRQEQGDLLEKRKTAEQRNDITAIKGINRRLSEIGDQIADLADQADSQFGLADHYADLAGDPRFRMISRKYLIREAKTLRRLRTQFDKMVSEGTDISMKGMDKMLDDMSNGKRGSLKDDKGSSVDDLFGPNHKKFDF